MSFFTPLSCAMQPQPSQLPSSWADAKDVDLPQLTLTPSAQATCLELIAGWQEKLASLQKSLPLRMRLGAEARSKRYLLNCCVPLL